MRRQKSRLTKPKPISAAKKAKWNDGNFTGDLEQDYRSMLTLLANSVDAKSRLLSTADHRRVRLFFYADLVDTNLLSRDIINPLQCMQGLLLPEKVLQQISVPETDVVEKLSQAADIMSDGVVVLLLEGQSQAVLAHLPQVERRPIERTQSEEVIIGPHDSFSESLPANVAVIRGLLASSKLKVESVKIGRLSRTKANILYVQDVVQQKLVDEMRKRLNRIDIDYCQGSAFLVDFLDDDPKSIFPLMRVTERPHRVAGAIAEGRVALLVHGDPTALIAPTFFPEFVQSSEDYFERPIIGTFLRCLRLVSGFLAVFLPGLWITLVSFHHGIIPRPLFSSIAAGRENVPLTTILEAFLLLLAFDIVIEASTRLPNAVGQAIGIVGAIILGQSAVQANLVSPAMTIVVALAGLATYTSPSPALLGPLRLLKYIVLVASSLLGLFGFVWIIILLILHMTCKRSFGYPYLYPVAPFEPRGMLDIIARLPLYKSDLRPEFLAADNQRRMAEHLRPGPDQERPDET